MANLTPVSEVLTENKQKLVLVTGDREVFTLRVQDATGHNRAVAKLTVQQGRELWVTLGSWLAR